MSNEEMERLLYLINEGYNKREIINILGIKEHKFDKLVIKLKKEYKVSFEKGTVHLEKHACLDFQQIDFDKNAPKKFVFISDTHLGNKKDRLDLINKIYEEAVKRGIKFIIHTGDLIEGVYKGIDQHKEELRYSVHEDQIDYMIKNYPKADGIKTCLVTGNHDYSLYKNYNVDLGDIIKQEREDFIYLGYSVASVYIGELAMLLYHGNKDLNVFKRYSITDIATDLNDNKYNVIAKGHSHTCGYYFINDTHCFQVPSLSDVNPINHNGFTNRINGVIFAEFYKNEYGGYDLTQEVKVYQKSKKY